MKFYKLNIALSKLSIYYILNSVLLFVFSICSFIKLTLLFSPLYELAIKLFSLEHTTGLNYTILKNNYSNIINYLISHKTQSLEFYYLPISTNGKYHFEEVKIIFNNINLIIILSFILLLILLKFDKSSLFQTTIKTLNYTCNLIFFLTSSLILLSLIKFRSLFYFLHNLIFDNDYWLFDPKTDPIIKCLPEEFFLLTVLFILSLLIIEGIIFKLLYKKYSNNILLPYQSFNYP